LEALPSEYNPSTIAFWTGQAEGTDTSSYTNEERLAYDTGPITAIVALALATRRVSGVGHIGASRKGGFSLFNQTPSRVNCVNSVCAFLNTIKTGKLHTASPNVAYNGGKIREALNQIAKQTGLRVAQSPRQMQSGTLNTGKQRQFFIVFQGSNSKVSGHVVIGINNKGNKTIFDPQSGQTYKNLKDFNDGNFTAWPVGL